MVTSIWVERYRPKALAEVVFQNDQQRRQFEIYLETGDIPNLLLSGVQGTGKSTLSKILVSLLKVDRSDVLRINCSDKKIDAIRNEVTNFAMTMPLGKFKIVQLEEIDYLSLEAQALLRSLIEDSSAGCRFIATCNYENKILPPLKSRFQQFTFKSPDKESIVLRLVDILEKEKVSFEPDDLLTVIDVAYPDIRKMIQLLQANSVTGALVLPNDTKSDADWKFGLLSALSAGDWKKARKLVCESATREEHEEIFTFLYQNIEKLKVKDSEMAVVTIADYMAKHPLVADTELNIAALFISLSRT
jgi:DNA polymerase III delta prime subunit